MSLLLLLLGCTDYGYTQLTAKDVFQQVRRTTVDVLLVVDDSCSMGEEQDKLAANFDSFISAFEGVDVDWQIGVITTDVTHADTAGALRGGQDEVVLLDPEGRVLDRVAWDEGWPVLEGAALQLDPASTSVTANDDADAWCAASEPWASGDLGSPGAPNPGCDGSPAAEPPEPDVLCEPRAPAAGEVVFTELLVAPLATDDAHGEWVELGNLTGDCLDLTGHVVVDEGRNVLELPAGLLLPPEDVLVIGRSADVAANGGVAVDVVASEGALVLADPVRLLTPEVADAAELFSEMVAVGTEGAGWELGLEAALLAVSEPMRSGDNQGLLRDDAGLAIIFLSDEDDYSPEPADHYLAAYGATKGDAAWREPGVLTVSAVAGVDPPPYQGALSCSSDDGAAEYGARYVELAARAGGAIESICDEDFSPIATELGLVVSGLSAEFALSRAADASTLDVAVYASQEEASLIAHLEQDVDYLYLPERNAIRFETHALPPSESWIVVEYELLATGQEAP